MLKPVKEIVYVFMKGQGWIPTVVREDVRYSMKKVNFGWSGGWGTPGTATTAGNFTYTWLGDDF